MLNGAQFPQFLCPNCRAVSDLEAELEDHGTDDEWMRELQESDEQREAPSKGNELASSVGPIPSVSLNLNQPSDSADISPAPRLPPSNPFSDSYYQSHTVEPMDTIPRRGSTASITRRTSDLLAPSPELSTDLGSETPATIRSLGRDIQRTPSPMGQEGPMTPTNDAGPFVFDGSAGRESGSAGGENAEVAQEADGSSSLPS